MITAAQLIQSARSLEGVRWRHLGRSRTGVDCIGLVILASSIAGLDLLKALQLADRRYERRADPALLQLLCDRCERVEPMPGALLLMRFDNEVHARHLALLTERETIIHSEARTRRQVIEHGYRAQWIRWTHSAWKLPGVRYE